MAKMRVRPRRGKTDYPGQLDRQCRMRALSIPQREYRFHPERKWRFDLAWTGRMLAVEVDGGGFVQGRHSRGVGMERDAEKFAEAAILGWTVLRVTPRLVKNGTALRWVERWMQADERRSRDIEGYW